MLSNYFKKVKSWIIFNKTDLFIAGIIFLTGMASFGLGRLSILIPKKEPLTIENMETDRDRGESIPGSQLKTSTEGALILDPTVKGKYVASKSGTAYHLPWCPGALKIKESNKIWFQNKEEAESRGYKPAANCPGL